MCVYVSWPGLEHAEEGPGARGWVWGWVVVVVVVVMMEPN